MREPKLLIWKWAAGLLVLCNIALIATLLLKPQPGGPDMARETPHDFVVRSLQLNDSQTTGYDLLVHAHQADMRRLRKQAMDNRQLLFSRLGANDTGAAADSISVRIANTQKEIELVTYRHFAQLRALCNARQQAEFDRIIGDVIRKMNTPPPPPHGPGEGDRRGPEDEGRPPGQ